MRTERGQRSDKCKQCGENSNIILWNETLKRNKSVAQQNPRKIKNLELSDTAESKDKQGENWNIV